MVVREWRKGIDGKSGGRKIGKRQGQTGQNGNNDSKRGEDLLKYTFYFTVCKLKILTKKTRVYRNKKNKN